MVAEPATARPESLRISGAGRTGAVRAKSRASAGEVGIPQFWAAADGVDGVEAAGAVVEGVEAAAEETGMKATSAQRRSERMRRVSTAERAASEPTTTMRAGSAKCGACGAGSGAPR